MGLSVIIVNYKSSGLIIDCLESAFRFASAKTFEWIVVDNHSEDGSREKIRAVFPGILWIQMAYNAGFARANNEGIQQAQNDMVLLLNPDTLILDDAIHQCYERLVPSEYVACSVQLLNPDHSPQITGHFFMKGGLNHLLPLPYLGPFLKAVATMFRIKKPNIGQVSGKAEVDWINGAFMMVRKSAIEQAGLLDPDFFLYGEEVEWCSRLRKTGKIVVFGHLHIIHLQGESFTDSGQLSGKGYTNLFDTRGLQLIVSNQLRIRKQFGVGWFLLNLLIYTIEIPFLFFGSLWEFILNDSKDKSPFKRLSGYTLNILRLWNLTPKMIKNQPWFYKMF